MFLFQDPDEDRLESCYVPAEEAPTSILSIGVYSNSMDDVPVDRMRDAPRDTALHEAVFHGHQGCVWAVSRPFDI